MAFGERDNRNTNVLEEIPLRGAILAKNEYWKIIGLEGRTKINTDRYHTWDTCYRNVTEHLLRFLKNELGYVFDGNNLEHVSADPSYDMRDVNKIDIQPDLLPRGVFLFTHDINQSGIVNIPSMDQTNMFKKKPRFTAMDVRYKKDPNDGLKYDVLRDLGFTISADYRYNNMLCAFTVMTATLAERMEVARLWKENFPDNVSHEIYRNIFPFVTDFNDEIPIAYDLEAVIPRELENTLKKVFGIDYLNEDQNRRYKRPSDVKLLELLQKHSETPVDLKVIGGKGELYFVFKYKAQIILTTESIQEDSLPLNNLGIQQTRFQFIVTYPEVTRYAIHAELTVPNTDNPKAEVKVGKEYLIADDKYKVLSTQDIRFANWPDEIDGCTLENNLIYKLSDFDIVKDNIGTYLYAKIDFSRLEINPLVSGFIKRAEMRYGQVYTEPSKSKARGFYNIVAIRKKIRKFEENTNPYGNTVGTTIDYINGYIKDDYAEENEEIFIGIYINKKEYTVFLERMGYTQKPNLARETPTGDI